MKKKIIFTNIKPENQDDVYKDGRIPLILSIIALFATYYVGSVAIAKLIGLRVNHFLMGEWALWFYPIQKMKTGVELQEYLTQVVELSSFGLNLTYILSGIHFLVCFAVAWFIWPVALRIEKWQTNKHFVEKSGYKLLDVEESFKRLIPETLKLKANKLNAGFAIANQNDLNPMDFFKKDKKGEHLIDDDKSVALAEDIRRKHAMYVGSTGRGKTQKLTYDIMQTYKRIRVDKDKCRMFILDTPKQDFTGLMEPKDVLNASPQYKYSSKWLPAIDINDELSAEVFIDRVESAKLKGGNSQDQWTIASKNLVVGFLVFLQKLCPEQWNLSQLAYFLTRGNLDDIRTNLLTNAYPKGSGTFNTAGNTFAGVLMNTQNFINCFTTIAEWNDDFQNKQMLFGGHSRVFKNPQFIEWAENEICYAIEKMKILTPSEIQNYRLEEGGVNPFYYGNENLKHFGSVFFKYIKKLTDEKPDWNWEDLKKYIIKNKAQYYNECIISKDRYSEVVALRLDSRAEYWDEIENTIINKGFSIKNWITKNPMDASVLSSGVRNVSDKKVFVMAPDEAKLTTGYCAGLLGLADMSILSNAVPNNSDNEDYIYIDELPAFGDIENFLNNGLALYRSKGFSVNIALQDISQLVTIYQSNFKNFIQSNMGAVYFIGVGPGESSDAWIKYYDRCEYDIFNPNLKKTDNGYCRRESKDAVLKSTLLDMGTTKDLTHIKYLLTIAGDSDYVYTLQIPIIKNYSGSAEFQELIKKSLTKNDYLRKVQVCPKEKTALEFYSN